MSNLTLWTIILKISIIQYEPYVKWQQVKLWRHTIPGYSGDNPFVNDAIVANCAVIDSKEVIFCCKSELRNRSATDGVCFFNLFNDVL